MPKLMYMSTSYNKGIYATIIVQCAAACKWLQPGSGLFDAFLTGQVDACVNLPRYAPTLGEYSCRELPRTPEDVRPFTKATPAQNKSTWQKPRPFKILTHTPLKTALEAETAKIHKTKVATTLVPMEEGKSAKRQQDTEEETLVCGESFGNSMPGEKWVSCTECG